jgi:hypothetical protein
MTEVPGWLTVVLLFVNGIGIPLLIFNMTRQDRDRSIKFEEVHKRLDHLDDCVDTTQKLVLGKAVTREDFASMKAEINETLTRMRTAISIETTGLHDRIMRVENQYFRKQNGS